MNGYQQSNGHNWREVTQGQLGINDFWYPNTGLSFYSKLGAHFQVINAHEAVDQPLERDYGDITQDIGVYFPICNVVVVEHKQLVLRKLRV